MIVEILLKIHFPAWCCWNVSLCLHARFLLFPLILSRVFMFPLTSQKERHDDINNVRVAPPPASSQTRPHSSNCERDPGRKWRDLSMLISLETNRCVSPYLEAYGDSESAVKRAAAKYAAAGVCKRWLGRFMHAEMGSVHQVQAGDLEKKKHSSGGISVQNVEKTCFWSHLKYVCGADLRIRAFPVKS